MAEYHLTHIYQDVPGRAYNTAFWDSEESMVKAMNELDDYTLNGLEVLGCDGPAGYSPFRTLLTATSFMTNERNHPRSDKK